MSGHATLINLSLITGMREMGPKNVFLTKLFSVFADQNMGDSLIKHLAEAF